MSEKKKTPCRQCGKLFVPCSYCKSHADVFRWRNFVCSLECAKTYISNTIEYRESQKNKSENSNLKIAESQSSAEETLDTEGTTTKRKYTKKVTENVIENNKTE